MAPLSANTAGRLILAGGSGGTVVVSEGLPETQPRDTVGWEVGRYYVEERTVRLPYPMERGVFARWLLIYPGGLASQVVQWEGEQGDLLPLFSIAVQSW